MAREPVVVGDNREHTSQLTIQSWRSGVPEFALMPPEQVLSISFYNQDTGNPIWIVIPEHFEPASGEFVGGNARQVRPVGEPSPDMLGVDGAGVGGVLASKFKYGVLPSGFQQLVPAVGDPPLLERGTRYLVTINAHQGPRLTFTAEIP